MAPAIKAKLNRLFCCLFCTTLPFKGAIALVSPTKPNLLILGLGRVGSEVATLARERATFGKIIGTVQANEIPNFNYKELEIQTIEFCPDKLKKILPTVSHVLVTIPPPSPSSNAADKGALEQIYDNAVSFLPETSWIGVLSTTGVYGHHDGKWVDEDADLLCLEGTSASAFRDMERQWQRRVEGNNVRRHRLCIFRCAGIYGPDSSALHTVYKRGLPKQRASFSASANIPTTNSTSIKAKGGITNRIHVQDIARAVLAAMIRSYHGEQKSARVYNLGDDLPESRQVVMDYAAHLLESINVKVPSPKGAAASGKTSSSKTRSRRRSTELKLVSNKRLTKELLRKEGLLFPTYTEGLKAILTEPNMPWECTQPNNKVDDETL